MNGEHRRAPAQAGRSSINSPAALFEAGLRHLQLGEIAEAEKHCRLVLSVNPDHADALHLLGLISVQLGRFDHAVELITRAIKQNPDNPEYFANLGLVLQRRGQLDEAIKSYDLALQLKPDFVAAWNNLGGALQMQRRSDEALLSYEQALKIDPLHLEATNNRATLLFELERYQEALACFDRSDQIKPGQATTHYMRGFCLQRMAKFEEALSSYHQALTIAPDDPGVHNNLGAVLQAFGRNDEALLCFDSALALRPNYPEALTNRGDVLSELRRFDEAFSSFDQATAINQEYAPARLISATLRLLIGDFEAGWAGREWRWKCAELRLIDRQFSQPVWLGDSAIAGKTVLLHSDEGLGDAIHFARYVPMVAALGAKVIVEVPDALHPLLTDLPGISQCLPRSGGELPAFDLHCPLTSLPLAFGTRLETIPAKVAYLPAPPEVRRQTWETRLGPRDRPRVGLVWSGNPAHKNDRNRSITLRALSAILDLDATFVSLQKDVRTDDKSTLRDRAGIIDPTAHLVDFSETAALVCCLDLVISVDTSVAHLAGALGCPVWIMLPYIPDYRWLLDRDDSPWYPTVRLFRQTETREWPSVLDRVRAELEGLIAGWRPAQEAGGLFRSLQGGSGAP
jgi:tetratricopeptide (TPR) repeat protein